MKRRLLFLGLTLSSLSAAETLPSTLSLTGLYSDIGTKIISKENLAYEPQYPLWSEGSNKARWLYLPPGTRINNGKPGSHPPAHRGNMDYWIFPTGTKFWKEFSFPSSDGNDWHRVETRFMEKTADGSWIFASYLWNEGESEAVLMPEQGQKEVYPIRDLVKHDIPSRSQCVTCHNRGGDMVLGFDALQLSDNRDALAPHAIPSPSGGVSLTSLADSGRLSFVPDGLTTSPPMVRASTPQGRAVMGYLHANCGNCHNPTGTANHSWLFFRYPWDTADEASSPVFTTAINRMSAVIQIPGQSVTLQIKPGEPELSAVVFAMETVGEHHMPPLGSKLPDEKAILLIKEWIRGLR